MRFKGAYSLCVSVAFTARLNALRGFLAAILNAIQFAEHDNLTSLKNGFISVNLILDERSEHSGKRDMGLWTSKQSRTKS